MLAQFEQATLYNAMNFSRSIYSVANSTIYATGLMRASGARATAPSAGHRRPYGLQRLDGSS